MKHLITLSIALLLLMDYSLYGQLKVKSDGKIGIRTLNPSADIELYSEITKFSFTPGGAYQACPLFLTRYYDHPQFYPSAGFRGYFGLYSKPWYTVYSGNLYYFYACTNVSDIKYKKNISKLNNSLDRILQLDGIRYDLDLSSIGFTKENDEKFGKNHLGLIAQDVIKIVPEVVKIDSNGYGIDYMELIPLLIEAIKEQNAKILDLESKISENSKLKSTDNGISNDLLSAMLGKNVPNPFDQNTSIDFYLPSTILKAAFYIYDLQGKQIKSISITDRGQGNIVIKDSELLPGIYYYSLIADGMQIGIEKMILTE